MILWENLLTFVLAQFSKLISGSATEGMYIRSITNIKQLKEHQILLETEKELIEELCKVKDSIKAQKIETKKGVPPLAYL
jgi:hypothetical protein